MLAKQNLFPIVEQRSIISDDSKIFLRQVYFWNKVLSAKLADQHYYSHFRNSIAHRTKKVQFQRFRREPGLLHSTAPLSNNCFVNNKNQS
jgi:hypothetical protein